MKITVIQMNSKDKKSVNVNRAIHFIEQAAAEGTDVVSLPEYFNFLGDNDLHDENSESIPGATTNRLMELARKLGINIHAGSIIEKKVDGEKFYNTSVFINREGEIVGKYRKIHLFDVEIEGRVLAKESDSVKRGNEVTVLDTDIGKVGLSICYDLRFPELYRTMALQGAKVLFVPAAFTLYTGIHHWETLLRARAIENQCFVVASGQFGSYPPENRTNFGSSMIIDPWGIVIARASEKEGFVTATIDIDEITRVRQSIPCLEHRVTELYEIGG